MPRPELVVAAEEVERMRQNPAQLVMDARAAARYRGEIEPIDPVAGHIPGAINAPYQDNLAPNGVMKSAQALRARYKALVGGIPAEECAIYCGSGVTAVHNILAIQHAGLGEARLYSGSWSDWVTDPERAVAEG
jgi:thiosulfate/3-mercaptopyruvate sulfurtransferase